MFNLLAKRPQLAPLLRRALIIDPQPANARLLGEIVREISQCEIPLTVDISVGADFDPQIAVGSEVRFRAANPHRNRAQQHQPAEHYIRPVCGLNEAAKTIRPTAAIQLAPARSAIRPHSTFTHLAASRP